ncbi:hypothetical protein MRX96_014492 [Rhipicephalus microplus]
MSRINLSRFNVAPRYLTSACPRTSRKWQRLNFMSTPNTVVCTARHDEYLLREERSFNLAALSTNVYVPMRPVPLECFLTLCRTCCLHCVDLPTMVSGA